MVELRRGKGGRPIPDASGLIVVGALNYSNADRALPDGELDPVQVFTRDRHTRLDFFRSLSHRGVTSLAFASGGGRRVYCATLNRIYELELDSLRLRECPIGGLRDVHEITLVDDALWIANTKCDEVVAYDCDGRAELARYSLAPFRREMPVDAFLEVLQPSDAVTRILRAAGSNVRSVGGFHCNQVFQGWDGALYALVHHIAGYCLVVNWLGTNVRLHGTGGLLNLTTGETVSLGLKGPHTVRMFDEGYLVFDSGRATLNLYDRHWNRAGTIGLKGWGRGACFLDSPDLAYCGISEVRRRYRLLSPELRQSRNMVQVVSLPSRRVVHEFAVANLEQINGLYPASTALVDSFRALA